jgi:hypothetical protein
MRCARIINCCMFPPPGNPPFAIKGYLLMFRYELVFFFLKEKETKRI